ncbi:MAG: nucleoside triphosphate pyrophosphohydrolase [Chloroflexota bacterium]
MQGDLVDQLDMMHRAGAILRATGHDHLKRLEIIEAGEIARLDAENALGEIHGIPGHGAWYAPTPATPLVIANLQASTILPVRHWLLHYYPSDHSVDVVRVNGESGAVESTTIDRLTEREVNEPSGLYVPPLPESENVRTFAGLMSLARTLRAPAGCPWDREQTHGSLKPHLLEEAYEVMEALDRGEAGLLAEELGDLLFQVVIHSQVAAEDGEFTIEDVLQGIICKLIGRHPHVYGELELENAQAVWQNWESFKQREKPKRTSILEQIPEGLPALPRSSLIQKRAAGVGFEWPGLAEVMDKVEEELHELRHEVIEDASRVREREEYGDILFALVSAARHLHIDPEEALRRANQKFVARFQYVESRVAALDQSMRDLSPGELDAYWQEAKAIGGQPDQKNR